MEQVGGIEDIPLFAPDVAHVQSSRTIFHAMCTSTGWRRNQESWSVSSGTITVFLDRSEIHISFVIFMVLTVRSTRRKEKDWIPTCHILDPQFRRSVFSVNFSSLPFP